MSLVGSNEPLRLADGSLVYPGGRIVGASAAAISVDVNPKPRVIRKIDALPDSPQVMNTVSVVLCYTLFGLSVEDIATVTRLSDTMVERIQASDAYSQMHDIIIRSVLDAETSVVREFISKNARSAAQVMVESLGTGNRSDRLAAARDILDRSGHRPADVVEHRHSLDGSLVIEYVKRSGDEVPTIDMEVLK